MRPPSRPTACRQPCSAFRLLTGLLIASHITPVNAISSPDTPSPWSHDIPAAPVNASQQPFAGAPDTHAEAATAPLLPASGRDAHWPLNPLEELHAALSTMQSRYFELWLGQWPTAIDWTAAVIGTFVSATLHSLTRSLEYVLPGAELAAADGQRVENEIGKYFSQTLAYYFGEDAFSIRMQAYDDMLWVVLGWLESIRFIDEHARRHYAPLSSSSEASSSSNRRAWYGEQFKPAFAHRAHVFYDIASEGWDERLCGGGMTWNPRLTPYKNAITNELFISASIGMYLYFPGDANTSPFAAQDGGGGGGLPLARPHDRKYLAAAVDGYNWLRGSNMTNKQGLYVDGFHIRNWGKNGSIGTGKCDVRNEMTYTYNQGVLLSGLRGLWEGTGEQWYLEDGHELVRNVIRATGWAEHERRRERKDGKQHGFSDEDDGEAEREAGGGDVDPEKKKKKRKRRKDPKYKWHGMGRDGILEELCDANGTCNQNGQTFKGIFFHHLTTFCEPLPLQPTVPGVTFGASRETASLHRQSCKEYAPWVAHNARMALKTRDQEGRFGMWWGAPNWKGKDTDELETAPLPPGAVDYRNNETLPRGGMWMPIKDYDWYMRGSGEGPSFMGFGEEAARKETVRNKEDEDEERADVRDKNDRGRGRTVETQAGGVAVVRALWEFVNMYRE